MYNALDVAHYFLKKCDPEAGDTISNLKLQKLIYYAQGFSLAIKGQPLFNEEIRSWAHGPVVPEIYQEFKRFGSNEIPLDGIPNVTLDSETVELLDEVYDVYGQFSAWKLRNMTHEEEPWKNSSVHGDVVITHDALKEYFKTLIN